MVWVTVFAVIVGLPALLGFFVLSTKACQLFSSHRSWHGPPPAIIPDADQGEEVEGDINRPLLANHDDSEEKEDDEDDESDDADQIRQMHLDR